MVDGTNTVEHLSGWFYFQASYPQDYLPVDHPDIKKYYLFGETECGIKCRICMPVSEFPLLTNNSCGDTIY